MGVRDVVTVVGVAALVLGWSAVSAKHKAISGTYTNKAYGITMSIPEFAEDATRPAVQLAQFFGPAEDKFAANVNVQVQFQKTTVDAYIDATKSDMATLGLELTKVSKVKVSGHSAVEFEAKGTVRGLPLLFVSRAIMRSDHTVLITGTALASKRTAHFASLQRSVRSLRLK